MMATLKESGKISSEMDRFIRVVIGIRSESMQDLSSFVGMRSREHVELEDDMIKLRTSEVVASGKVWRVGGGKGGDGLIE